MSDEKELKDQRIPIMMSGSELAAVDDWSFNNRIRSRGEAIRRLIQVGLAVDSKMKEIFEQNLEILEADVSALEAMGREVMDEDGNRKEYIPPRDKVEAAVDAMTRQTSKLYDIVKEFHDVAYLAKSPMKTDEIQSLIAENEKLYDRILGRDRKKPSRNS